MKRITAIWNYGTYVSGDELPMCSASERNEMFLVGAGWHYEMPINHALFSDKPTVGECYEVVGEDNTLIGYACPVKYIFMGEIFDDMESCSSHPWFHPNDYQIVRLQDIDKVVAKQLELIEDDGWGD
jgi:hypothetical protein